MEATTTKGGALTGQERRAEIMNILRQSTMPLSGAALGKQLGVSRQVVVQDIALLRQSGEEIYATNRGYVTGVANAVQSVCSKCIIRSSKPAMSSI